MSMFWRRSEDAILDEILAGFDADHERIVTATSQRTRGVLRGVVAELRMNGYRTRDIFSLIETIIQLIQVIGPKIKEIVDAILALRNGGAYRGSSGLVVVPDVRERG